jgi:hypothetical protein
MSEESRTFNSGVEFIDFLTSNQGLKKILDPELPQITNMEGLRKMLDKRPCSCGGVNPDAVLAERRSHFEIFYSNWVKSLQTENIDLLKSTLGEGTILKSKDQILIKL